MFKFGTLNTINYVKDLGITLANDQPEDGSPKHILECCALLESLWLNNHQVIGYAHEVIFKGKIYDFLLLSTSMDGAWCRNDVKVSLILFDDKEPLVFTDKLKSTTPLKNGISVLCIDYDHFKNMKKIILEFIADHLKYQAIEA